MWHPPLLTFQPLLVHIGKPCAAVDGKPLRLPPEAGYEGLLLPRAAGNPLVVALKVKGESGVLLKQREADE